MEIAIRSGVQLAALEQATSTGDGWVDDVVNMMEIDAAPLGSTVGRSNRPNLVIVDLVMTRSVADVDNIIDEYADLQGVEVSGCTNLQGKEGIGGCTSFCKHMSFKDVPELVLPWLASPLVANVQK